MKVLLTAHGSRGDVYPMIALGRQFRSEGHGVTILTQANHRAQVEASGAEGIYTSEDMRESMAKMGGGWTGVRRVLDWSRQSLAEEFALLEDVIQDMDLVVSTNQEFSVASLAEWRKIPAFRLSYIPGIPGDHTPPLIPWQELPVPINRLLWKGLGAGLDFMAKGTINTWREAHGLKAVPSLSSHMTSIFLTLYGFNRTLAPPHPSWNPESYRYCGYCFEEQNEKLPTELENFLNAGAKPIFLGFGSITIPNPNEMTRMALDAALMAGCRLVISRGWTGLGAESVLAERPYLARPDRIYVTDDVPHAHLFPRLAGVCHHGGAGTTHRASLAGVPQLIMPVFVDQHFWGNRIYRVGAGPRPVTPKKMSVKTLTQAFQSFVDRDRREGGVGMLSQSVAQDRGIPAAYDIILQSLNEVPNAAIGRPA